MLITIKKFIANSQSENGKVNDKDLVNLLFKPLISTLFFFNDRYHFYSGNFQVHIKLCFALGRRTNNIFFYLGNFFRSFNYST